MAKPGGAEIILRLKNQWQRKAILSNLLLSFAITLPVYAVLYKLFSASVFWAAALLAIIFAILSFINKMWRLDEWQVSRFLNATTPSLEESTQLVLQPTDSFSLLEKMQRKKVETALGNLSIEYPFKRQLRIGFLLLLIGIVMSVIITKLPLTFTNKVVEKERSSTINTVPETVLPEIKKTIVTIIPPAYTKQAKKQQNRFNIQAEEGSTIVWNLQTTVSAKKLKLIFNDGTNLNLTNDEKSQNWQAQRSIQASGFYQVSIDGKLSELYRIEMIKDQKPIITVQSPKPSTTIVYGQPEKALLSVSINDDYGISQTYISATISSGQGEAVKFNEQRLSFADFAAGGQTYRLQKMLDCKALGMKPGDELYFFVSAKDSKQQESRSDVYIVTLEDTTGLFTMEGMATALDIKPELFRSQRQIIIETEQLLRDKPNISEEEFKTKSNDLGTDQKLLRLRYGKFLGEETDTEIGGGHDQDDDHGSEDVADIQDQYSHKHDNAEDATFFDAATKKQLKETLNEMWKAELQLRTMKPKDALPFEYKALRLLKDLQQQSRVYVAKTGAKINPLKPEKRLSGDLSGIQQPVAQRSVQTKNTVVEIRKALGILEQLKYNGLLEGTSQTILQEAFQELSSRAANEPAVYLTALAALRKVMNDEFRLNDIVQAQAGLQKMVALVERLPSVKTTTLMELQKSYFSNLNKMGR
ncbi:MAG: DUF4175 family protein [Chitinophagaceae bacterium]|nr:MAG: DUF4175 family protein [Chitinophagaceae bacterium]